MTYIWFQSVLEALGKRINYESISNLYGNSFAKDSAKLIQGANPLIKQGVGSSANPVLSLAGKMTIIESKNKAAQNKELKKVFGDTSWFDEFIEFSE